MQQRDFPSVWTAICAGGGWGLGWLLAITAIAAIRERIAAYSNIPRPLRGVGITFHSDGPHGNSLHELPRHQDLILLSIHTFIL